jgi:predicted O-methyltransferase YrrM
MSLYQILEFMNILRNIAFSNDLSKYIEDVSLREHDILKKMREESFDEKTINMQSSPQQAQFICFLANLINAKKILEIGIYKGYTTLALALNTPSEVKITALESNKEWAEIAMSYWVGAEIDHKICLKLAPALDSLIELNSETEQNYFDLIFIDADKKNYINYYEESLNLIKNNGLIIIDNILWGGDVINPNSTDERTKVIRTLNELLKNDDRIELTLLPIRDGITLIRKK